MRKLHSNRRSRNSLIASLTAPFIVTSALTLMGCAQSTPPLPVRTPIPASLMQPCPPLQPLQSGDGATVLRSYLGVVYAYKGCAAAHAQLIQAVSP